MRFCMITTFYPPYAFGGDGVYVQQLSNELAKRGHQVEVVHCRDAYNLLAGRIPPITYHDHSNVTVHSLKSPLGFWSPLATHQSGRPIVGFGYGFASGFVVGYFVAAMYNWLADR